MGMFNKQAKSINLLNKFMDKVKIIFKKVSLPSIEAVERDKNKPFKVCFDGHELGNVKIDEIKLDDQKANQDEVESIPINFNSEFTFEVKVPKIFIRIINRQCDNERLFRIMKRTRKNRTKKKIAKRILKNCSLNLIEKLGE